MPKQRVIVFWLLYGMHHYIHRWPNFKKYDKGYKNFIEDERYRKWDQSSELFEREIAKELNNES